MWHLHFSVHYGRMEANFSEHLALNCKVTFCHEDMRKFAFSLGKANEQTQMDSVPPIFAFKIPLSFCYNRSLDWPLYPMAIHLNFKNKFNIGAIFALTTVSTITFWFIEVTSALLLDATHILKFCWLTANNRTGMKIYL